MMLELADGLPDATTRGPWEYMSTTDVLLSAAVFAAPFLLLVASRFSCGRWVHQLSLLPGHRAGLTTYNVMGQRRLRVMPATNVQRSTHASDRIVVSGKTFLLPKGGEMLDTALFERSFRAKS